MKSQERATCDRILGGLKDVPKRVLSMEQRPQRVPSDLRSLVRLLGLREVVTPATWNCVAMAVAQTYAYADMRGESDAFERLTTSVKRGIWFAGLLNLDHNYARDVRVQALRNVRRGWTTIKPKELAILFRWFLHDYTSFQSNHTSTVDGTVWGGRYARDGGDIFHQDIFLLHVGDEERENHNAESIARP
uniref:Transposase n=1 Tax=Peronospora matthiolae TaxID=2874970 RepID=A0AAV1TGM4_9STRA